MRTTEVDEIVNRIMPMLAGKGPDVQGAVLADLVVLFLAGHQGEGADYFRDRLLKIHVETVRKKLITISEAAIRQRH